MLDTLRQMHKKVSLLVSSCLFSCALSTHLDLLLSVSFPSLVLGEGVRGGIQTSNVGTSAGYFTASYGSCAYIMETREWLHIPG